MYTELHARSAFSFLEGASLPEELIARCAELGMKAMALLDRDGVYGAPRFHVAAKKAGIRAHIGAEITATDGRRYPLLAENRRGYQNLCQLITRMKLRAKKNEGRAAMEEMAEHAAGLICLWDSSQPIEPLIGAFGPKSIYAEVQRHFDREEEARNQAVIETARRLKLPLLATGGVCYARPEQRELQDVLTSIRHKITIERAGRLLAKNSERHLKPPAAMARLFPDLPEAIANTQELSSRLEFTLADLGYAFPKYPVPPGESMNSFLRQRTDEGARRRYRPYYERAQRQVERELALIEKLELAGYFLIVWDIVQFCRREGILVQGRGSAANSAVCYSLGITAVDPVGMELLFERFLSEERGEWPDIDLDLPSGDKRERVIQHVYARYGERGAAMTANVITYRGRSAAREVGKVLGFDEATLARLSSLAGTWEWKDPSDTTEKQFREAGLDLRDKRIQKFFELYRAAQDLPRHLGQHSGGMVICQGQLDSVVPLEPATMPGRVVVEWDKEDCADMGIIKVDLLGLGMMAAIEETLIHIRDAYHEEVDLAHLPPDDPAVYSALQKADTIGLFQVESRAQMSCLPRLRPQAFYDIVVQVAIIRPGPIVGKMVNPYLKRRQGREPVEYAHPSLEPVLRRTLGVPLFQEQLLRMAMIVAGFTGGEAEELRRAMGFKRSEKRMREIEIKLRRGMERNGITGAAQDAIVQSIASFALYGFPESHAASFALLAYASAYLKCHYLAAFTAALLNNQPMGFYHPSTIVKDAQRHGLKIKPIDILRSDWPCAIEEEPDTETLRCVNAEKIGSNAVSNLNSDNRSLTVAAQNQPFRVARASKRYRGEQIEGPPIPSRDREGAVVNSETGHCSKHEVITSCAPSATTPCDRGPESDSEPRPEGAVSPVTDDALLRDTTSHPPHATSHKSLRLGLKYVRGLREQAALAIVRERAKKPFASIDELARRVPELRQDEIRTLAEIGALNSIGAGDRRDALWQAERAGRPAGPLLAELSEPGQESPLEPMTREERLVTDFHSTGLTIGPHPMAYRRAELKQLRVSRAIDLQKIPNGRPVRVAGCVICRQRPGTAKGFLFLSLEDETGIANAIVTPDLFASRRSVLVNEPFLLVDGVLQNQDGVISVKAKRVQPLVATAASTESHDFH